MILKDKKAIVTGSSRGIGLAVAKALAKQGVHILLNASKSIAELAAAKEAIAAYGVRVEQCIADVSDYTQCQQLFDCCNTSLGAPPDILINNAGVDYYGLFTQMHPQQWENILRTNLFSVMHTTHLALPAMIAAHQGAIVNISSIWGEKGASLEAVYAASKGGMNAFTKAIAREVGPSNILVNAVSCGVIDTTMNQWLDSQEKELLRNEIPLMRFGSPRSVADLCVFLCQSDYITGQVIRCDGGMI